MSKVTATFRCEWTVPLASQGERVLEESIEHSRTRKKGKRMGEEFDYNRTGLCGDLAAKKRESLKKNQLRSNN
jgi:hypothetical protein